RKVRVSCPRLKAKAERRRVRQPCQHRARQPEIHVSFVGDNCHPLGYVAAMKTLTIRDFRTRPKQAREELTREGRAVLTANGKPVAIMVPVDADSLEETASAIRLAQAQLAVRSIRERARQLGLDKM